MLLNEHLKDLELDLEKLNIETFGEIIDKFLDESECLIQIHSPAGSDKVEIEDNLNLGPVIHFYFGLKFIAESFGGFRDMLKDNADKIFIDDCLEILTSEIYQRLGIVDDTAGDGDQDEEISPL